MNRQGGTGRYKQTGRYGEVHTEVPPWGLHVGTYRQGGTGGMYSQGGTGRYEQTGRYGEVRTDREIRGGTYRQGDT